MSNSSVTLNADLNVNNIYISDNKNIIGSQSLTIDCPIINIGKANQQVNLMGNLASIQVNNLEINDQLIVLNKNGSDNTSKSAGITIATTGNDKGGYIMTNDDGTGFNLKAPLSQGIATLPLSNNCEILTNLSNINRTKISAEISNANKVLFNDALGFVSSESQLAQTRGGLGCNVANIQNKTFIYKDNNGNIVGSLITNDTIDTNASIQRSKIAADTSNKGSFLINNDNGNISSSSILKYNDGKLIFNPSNLNIINGPINYGYEGMNFKNN